MNSEEKSELNVEVQDDISLENEKPSIKNVLSNKSYMLVFLAQIFENVGGFAVIIALLFLIFSSTKSILLIGIFQIVTIIPNVILAPIAGVLVDRFDQRKIMMISIIVRVLTAVGLVFVYAFKDLLLIITYAEEVLPNGHVIIYRIVNSVHFLWPLFVIFILRVSIWPFFTPAKNAYFKLVIPKKDLLVANSLNHTVVQISGVVGPLVGGLLIAINYLIGFYFAIGTSLISVIFLIILVIKGNKPPEIVKEKVNSIREGWSRTVNEIKRGFGSIRSVKKVSYTIIIAALVSFSFAGLDLLWPVILQGEMNLSPRWYGAMDAVVSFCGILASIVILSIKKIDRKVVILTSVIILESIAIGLMGIVRNPWLMVFIIMLPFGIVNGLYGTTYDTLIQEKIPYEDQGKVQSVDWFLTSIMLIIGLVIVTALSKIVPSSYILYACGGLELLFALGGLLYIKRKKLYHSDYGKNTKVNTTDTISGK